MIDSFFIDLSMVIICAASLACVAVLFKQPILIAYIAAGMIFGPFGLGLLKNMSFIDSVSRLGVTLLLFLAGLSLPPRKLVGLFRESLLLTFGSAVIIWGIVFFFSCIAGFSKTDSAFIAAALMFSSTIMVVKLMPTIRLHQKYMGSLCIAILIAQDLIALGVLMYLKGTQVTASGNLLVFISTGVLLITLILIVEQAILRPLIIRMEYYHEVLFLVALGWCLGIALLAEKLGFSLEIGAFLAGIAFARNPIAEFFSEGLKVFRDFFLVLFFFVMGTKINVRMVQGMIWVALLLSAVLIMVKTFVYAWILRWMGKEKKFAMEVGIRMNQASEFALIISFFAMQIGTISLKASQLVQAAAVLTMLFSSYMTVLFYPTPLGQIGKLKQD